MFVGKGIMNQIPNLSLIFLLFKLNVKYLYLKCLNVFSHKVI